MKRILTEFNVIVKGNFYCNIPITEQRVYSEDDAFKIARQLSARYPASQIVIEEWKFIHSRKPLRSGYYRGRTIFYSPEAA